MRAVQDGARLQVPQLPALLQRAQEPRAARDARMRARPQVPLSVLRLQQAPPQRAQEAHREEAPCARCALAQPRARGQHATRAGPAPAPAPARLGARPDPT